MNRPLSYLAAATALAFTPACAQDAAISSDREAVEEIIYSYLMENPEVLEEALIALQVKRQNAESERARAAIAERLSDLIDNPGDNFIGPAEAPVTVVEFFDYRCGYCKQSASWTSGLPEKYDNKVRVVFKELPILSAESEKAALAAVAAGKQDKYIEMHMGLMELDNGSGFTAAQIDAVAERVGVDVAKMRADMSSIAVQTTVSESKSLARSLGIDGTPNFIVGTDLVGGADVAQVEALIEAQLADVG